MTDDTLWLQEKLAYLCRNSSGPDVRRATIMHLLITAGLSFRVEAYPGHDPINILIEFGENPHRFIVGGHYDTIGLTPGANDNGMGVLALIMLALRLQAEDFRGDLTIALFDLEENLAGGGAIEDMGSYCLIEKRDCEDKEAERTLILDVIGVGDTPFISTYGSMEVDKRVFEHLTEDTKSIPPSDNLCFMDAGWPVWLLCTALKAEVLGGYPETYHRFHTGHDTPDQEDINPSLVVDIVGRVQKLVAAWNDSDKLPQREFVSCPNCHVLNDISEARTCQTMIPCYQCSADIVLPA